MSERYCCNMNEAGMPCEHQVPMAPALTPKTNEDIARAWESIEARDKREQRRYEIARDIMAAAVSAFAGNATAGAELGAEPYSIQDMARDAVSSADALLTELEK